jgi:predicted nucleic acid-binding protein
VKFLLIDTNIVLDVLLERKPWVDTSKLVWQAVDDSTITGLITATTFTNISFIVQKAAGSEAAAKAIQICLATFEICLVNRATLELAASFKGADFEDNVQIACALQSQLEAIVTRDKTGFLLSPIAVLTPSELIETLAPSPPDQR